jgi:hypothetical protein
VAYLVTPPPNNSLFTLVPRPMLLSLKKPWQ